MSGTLSISIVAFDPDLAVLRDTVRSLAAALAHARGTGRLGAAKVWIVDNGPGDRWTAALRDLARSEIAAPVQTEIFAGHGNIGYGRAHNLAIRASNAEYHLVLNPDVRLDVDAVDEAIGFMQAHPGVVMLAPQVRDAAGALQYPCKRYPSVFDLLLRGFAPPGCRHAFDARLARYEMRDLPQDSPTLGVPIISGSFMFCRRAPLAALGGFSDAFFM
ncbi:MAG: glycosyltransferase, partial [Burkholderiales bacterium]